MSVIRFTEAPIKYGLLNGSGTLGKVWLQWFGDVSNSFFSYWGMANNAVSMSGVTSSSIVNKMSLKGDSASIYMSFDGLDSVSGTFTIDSKYKVLDNAIRITEFTGSNTLISWVFVENSSFSIPDQSTTSKIIISGEFLRQTGV
jgi:hypothetical protein